MLYMCVLWIHALLATNSYIGGQVHSVCMSSEWVGPGVGVRGNMAVMGSVVLGSAQTHSHTYT